MSFGVQGVTNPLQAGGSSSTTSLQPFANLNLTEDQRTQLRSIFKNAKSQGLSESEIQSQVAQVLTPEQQASLQADLQSAQSAQSQSQSNPFANLNLTQAQQTQIAQILQNAQSQGTSPSAVQSQINAVLTPAQQQTLQADVQTAQSAHSGHHHHHHGGGGGSASATSTTATVNGLTVTDIQNQVLAATSVNQQQVQSEVLSS
jgi:Spy/CpxP family protein refolding chaperone